MAIRHGNLLTTKNQMTTNQDQQDQFYQINNLRSLLESAKQNTTTLDEALRCQLLSNIDQVFHIRDVSAESAELVKFLRLRQDTLVTETLRRVLGRTKSIEGGLREAIAILERTFPKEKKG